MAGVSEWTSIAGDADPDELRERILTGYKSGKPFTPYVPTVELPSSLGRVLDFGCGLGRNFPYLKSIAPFVAGFDLEVMVDRCRSLASERIDLLTSDWAGLSARRFDLIFADLVLQHVDTEACRRYLADFATMSPTAYILTRLQSDFGANVLGLVAEGGRFDVVECAEVEHDPQSHQLRRVAPRSFAEVAHASDDRHYEVLLASRGWST